MEVSKVSVNHQSANNEVIIITIIFEQTKPVDLFFSLCSREQNLNPVLSTITNPFYSFYIFS